MSDEIRAYGIGARHRRGCDAHIYRRPPERHPHDADEPPAGEAQDTGVNPVAHLANFPLPEGRGDYGSGAVERMGPQDVLVCVLEFDREAAGTTLFAADGMPRFRTVDFAPSTMQRTIAGMSGAQAFFTIEGRAFCAYAVLGSHRNRSSLVPEVNALLDTLTIEPA